MGLRRESFPELLCILRERISQELGILEEERKITFAHTGATEFAEKSSVSSEKVSFQQDNRKNYIMGSQNSFNGRDGSIGECHCEAQVLIYLRPLDRSKVYDFVFFL